MGYLFDRIILVSNLILKGRFGYLWKVFSDRIKFEELAFGFRRDLNVEIKEPKVLMPTSIREFIDEDQQYFKDNPNNGLIMKFDTCYVAINKNSVPCSRLWLIDSSQNKKLKEIWKGNFPELQKDEMLIENVFTVPKFRGMGIVSGFMHEISKKAKTLGMNYVITFGAVKNDNTTRAFAYAGFNPFVLRRVKWFLFKKSVTYEEIPDNLLDHYKKVTKNIRTRTS